GPTRSGIRGLIVSPTRELATQIFQQCQTLRAHSKMECKLLTKASAAAVADVQSSMGKKHDVLVSTPARVVTLLKERALDLSTVEVCVIDEADKLFEDGFVHQIDEVLAGLTHPRLQKALFSATIPPQVSSVVLDVLLLIVCMHGLGAVLRYWCCAALFFSPPSARTHLSQP
ncbi:MAG: DEAD/DEAH box helicase, partial [Promethearchaeia archaeon]